MFETFSMIFFAIAGSLFLITAAGVGTFMIIWKTYSALYDASDSFFLSFFTTFFVAIIVCYFWLVLIWFGLPF